MPHCAPYFRPKLKPAKSNTISSPPLTCTVPTWATVSTIFRSAMASTMQTMQSGESGVNYRRKAPFFNYHSFSRLEGTAVMPAQVAPSSRSLTRCWFTSIHRIHLIRVHKDSKSASNNVSGNLCNHTQCQQASRHTNNS
jgi:hypothetical protein